MPTFAYTARSAGGQVINGQQAATSVSALRQELRARGTFLVEAKPRRTPGLAKMKKPKPRELILFTFNLQNVLDSGVPILSGLEDLRAETKDRQFRAVVGDLVERLNGGETLAQALRHHPLVFDRTYVSMVDAGEQSGRLPYVLERLLRLLEWRQELQRSIKDMTNYPIIIMIALCGLIALVLGFVFPRFMGVFDRIEFELPWATKVLIAASEFVQAYWWALILGAVVAAVGFSLVRKFERTRVWFDTMLLYVPVIGPLVRELNFGQVAKSLSSFVDAGIAIPRALELISAMVHNRRVGMAVDDARNAILSGRGLTDAFRDAKLFPPLILRMVSMGEQSGRLVDALDKVGTIYDREVPMKTKKLLDALSPILTGVMGSVLLFVVLAVMMPLYRMYQQIGTSY